jgi:methylmalonyl-CoA mutase
MRIEEAAARKQAHIDSGKETIVGVNKYAAAQGRPAGNPQHRQYGGA